MFWKREIEDAVPETLKLVGRYSFSETLTDIFHDAQSKVKIFSADLDNRQFAQPETVSAANLFLCCKQTSLDIIMSDTEFRKYTYHPLLDLRKNHPDTVRIRLMDDHHAASCRYEFIMADENHYFFREDVNTLGITGTVDASMINKLNTLFEPVWDRSKSLIIY